MFQGVTEPVSKLSLESKDEEMGWLALRRV